MPLSPSQRHKEIARAKALLSEAGRCLELRDVEHAAPLLDEAARIVAQLAREEQGNDPKKKQN